MNTTANPELILFICNNNQLESLDVSSNSNLNNLNCSSNNLNTLNVANGNNSNINNFNSTNNSNLSCIKIDFGFVPNTNWIKDATSSYDSNCTLLNQNFKLNNQISSYPNPVKEILTIQLENNQEIASLELLTLKGRSMKKVENTNSIDLENFATGIYLVKVEDKEGKLGIQKIVKE
ncbi:MAG: T9SS type A sorting domain-containing protein [Flavobacterium sp.]|nr:T9SS type A sorting domain-containing protein [Flavobacterium sp.]